VKPAFDVLRAGKGLRTEGERGLVDVDPSQNRRVDELGIVQNGRCLFR